jgi:hypothetical protein
MALTEITPEAVKWVLDKFEVYAIITKDQDSRLTAAGLNSKMPEGWDGADALARYKAVKIDLDLNHLA